MRILSKHINFKAHTFVVRHPINNNVYEGENGSGVRHRRCVESIQPYQYWRYDQGLSLQVCIVKNLIIFRKIQKETHTGMVSNIKKRFDCVIRVEV